MAEIIRDGRVEIDRWTHVGEGAINDHAIVSVARLDEAIEHGRVGVWVQAHEDLDCILEHLNALPLIALDFPVFADGRSYSKARHLRELGYLGEIRATGEVLRDQLLYMRRCGFDSFEVLGDPQAALKALNEFSVTYQTPAAALVPEAQRRVDTALCGGEL